MLSAGLSRVVNMLAVMVLLLMGTSRAAAAPLDIDIVDEEFGFCDGLVPERWTPMRVYIASRKEPFSGTLTVTYAQDGTQSTQLDLPVATTIGQVTPIEVAVCVPEALTQITFRFSESGSIRYREIKYELGGSLRQDPEYRDLPPEDGSGRRVIVFDGPRGLEEALTSRATFTPAPVAPGMPYFPNQPQNPTASPWLSTWSVNMPRERMPLAWVAYDCADLVVVRGDIGIGNDVVDSRALEALNAWVKAGGKLVVLVEPAGNAWARFVGTDGVVNMSEMQPQDMPTRARGVLLRKGEPEEGDDGKSGFASADKVSARWMTLTEMGASRGWTLEHSIATYPDGLGSSREVTLGTCAIGPVGFGTVMLVSCDPSKMSAVASNNATTRLWRDILTIILDRGTPRYKPSQNQLGTWYVGTSSGANDTERAALEYLFSNITRVPRLGHGTFIAIAGVVLVLALLVGPVDAIVLRKKGWRQHSWASALLWVAVASFASIAAPMIIRSSDDRAFRFASYDVIANENGAANFACREGATTILPGKGGLALVTDEGNGVVYRGASPIQKLARERPLGTILPLQQGVGETGTLRGVMPSVIGLRQWSVRAMLDQCPDAKSTHLASLRVECDIDAACSVRVQGLPAGASILQATVYAKTGWRVLGLSESTGAWSDPGPPHLLAPANWGVTSLESYAWRYDGRGRDDQAAFTGIGTPGVVNALPLSSTRSDTIDRLVETGQWACVYLHVLHWPSDVTIEQKNDVWATESQAVLRVLVPLKAPLTPLAPAATTTTTPSPSGQP